MCIKVYDADMHEKGFAWIELDEIIVSSNVSREVYEDFLSRLTSRLRKHIKEVVMVGDFNAKAHTWGSKAEDTKRKIRMELIA